jgi:hypothetical protein
MKNTFLTLGAMAAVLTLMACESDPRTLPPGEYSRTEKTTSSQGTDAEKTTKTNVYVDEHGNKKAVQSTETSTDPEGWFNKTTTKSTKTYN